MFAQRGFVVGILLAVALAIAPAARADDLPAPSVTTQAARGIVGTLAWLDAEVDTNGVPTTGYFVYGTAPDRLDQRTAEADLGSEGTRPLSVQLTDVAPNTTYYYAAVAENDDWVITGDTLSFATPRVPQITGGMVDGITFNSATLHLHVDTHGLPRVTVSGRVGTMRAVSPSLVVLGSSVFGPGASFRQVSVPPDGDVAIPLTGLAPGKTYSWTATPDGVLSRSTPTGSFATNPLLPVARPALSAAKAAYGSHVTISGTVPRPGALVTLAAQASPFVGPIVPTAVTTTADGAGGYAFDVLAERSARYGVTMDGAVPLTRAGLVRLDVFPAITARLQRAKGHRFRVTGSYRPHVGAEVSLFRRGGGRVGEVRESSGAFRFPARTLKPGTYEVRVTPDARPKLVAGQSRTFTVPRR